MPSHKQSLAQTQQLQQRLVPLQVRLGRMLEMSDAEAADEVRRELDDNPALELADTPTVDNPYAETAEQLQMADYRPDDLPYSQNQSAYNDPIVPVSLTESLLAQLRQGGNLNEHEMEIARHVVGNLDSNGYLTRDAEGISDDMAIETGRVTPTADIENVTEKVRGLDPPGIASKNLRDCLMLQAQRGGDTDAEAVLRDAFQALVTHDVDAIAMATGLKLDQVTRAVGAIRQFNPKPASAYSTATDAMPVIPDFTVEATPDGSTTVTMLNTVPELCVSASFDNAATDNSFIKRKRDDARDFIGLLRRRTEALMAIMTAIARRQQRFFATGDPRELVPLRLVDIAADVERDVSTVSRATNSRYVSTPWGVYPLKYLFPKGASDALLDDLQTLIDTENSPLSDDELAKQLQTMGHEVARRTVAKYREKLGIAPAKSRIKK